jgi:hypothetical protein
MTPSLETRLRARNDRAGRLVEAVVGEVAGSTHGAAVAIAQGPVAGTVRR